MYRERRGNDTWAQGETEAERQRRQSRTNNNGSSAVPGPRTPSVRSAASPLTRIHAGVVRGDGVRVEDGDVVLLGESEIPVHLLQELGRV